MADSTVTLPSSLQYAQRDLNEARVVFQAGVAALHTREGERLYGDAEHERRYSAVLDTLRRDVDAALTVAQEQQDAARQMLAQAAGFDPLDHLSGDDLSRARTLSHFVREDAADLSLPQLATRLAAVAADRDAVRRALYLRYAERRLARETDRARRQPRTEDDLEALNAVRRHLDTLRGSTYAGAAAERAAAEAIQQAAHQLAADARAAFEAADGTAARRKREHAASYARRF